MFFDARAAKLLKPGEHLVIDGFQGLRLVASVTRKSWTYRYKAADGRMRQTGLGQWPAVSVQAAAAAWQALREQRAAGLDPATEQRQKRRAALPPVVDAGYTVEALVEDYITGHLAGSRQEAGRLAAERALRRLLTEEPTFAAMQAADVTRADAFRILDARKATPTATQKLRSMLGSAWDLAHDAGEIPEAAPNWWRVVMKGRLKSQGKIMQGEHVGRQRRTLQPSEIGALIRWTPKMHALARDTTLMYLWTCARGVEILSARPEYVTEEPDGWWLTIPKEKTKNARFVDAVDFRIALTGRALEIVQRRLADVGESGWLFAGADGEQYTQHRYSTWIYDQQPYSPKAARREGPAMPVTNWTPHNLRRTGRTALASIGCPGEIAEEIIGHLPREIEATYNSHTYDREKRHWLGLLSQHLEQLAADHPPDVRKMV